MNALHSVADFNDLVFLTKNKEFGAYVLRKNYDKYLTIAFIVTAGFFVLAISSPVIIDCLNPKPPVVSTIPFHIPITLGGEVPSIEGNEKQQVQKIEGVKQLKSTIAFRLPVIKPDVDVDEDYVPSQIDLRYAEPGTITANGDPNAADPSLVEIEIPQVVPEGKEAKVVIFNYVEEMPAFPGGTDAFLSFCAQKIQYPEIAKRAGVEGRIFMSFIVSPSGAISDVQVVKGIGAGCDEEAVRVVGGMPKWNPGKQNGRPVNVKMSVPIIFRLQ